MNSNRLYPGIFVYKDRDIVDKVGVPIYREVGKKQRRKNLKLVKKFNLS